MKHNYFYQTCVHQSNPADMSIHYIACSRTERHPQTDFCSPANISINHIVLYTTRSENVRFCPLTLAAGIRCDAVLCCRARTRMVSSRCSRTWPMCPVFWRNAVIVWVHNKRARWDLSPPSEWVFACVRDVSEARTHTNTHTASGTIGPSHADTPAKEITCADWLGERKTVDDLSPVLIHAVCALSLAESLGHHKHTRYFQIYVKNWYGNQQSCMIVTFRGNVINSWSRICKLKRYKDSNHNVFSWFFL